MYDVIIIGKGPAGISASLYIKRANITVLVIGKGTGALEKAKTIEKFLGKGYKVEASQGHIRDLPVHSLGVDIKNNFEPRYVDSENKEDAPREAGRGSECIFTDTIFNQTVFNIIDN